MALLAVFLSLVFVAALAMMSVRAAGAMASDLRLPMQWGVDRQPIWFARRNLALSFTPVLAALTLIPTALLSLSGFDRSGAGVFFSVLIGMGLAWIGAHALHLWLVARWRRAEG